MKNSLYLMVIISLVALLSNAHSASIPPSLNAYLTNYVSNGVIANASFYNQTVGPNSYVVMQLSGKNNYLIIQNTSSGYSLVTNTTTIEGVLTPFLIARYYPSSTTLAYLNSTMREYMSYTNQNMTDCLIETGLDQNTCTLANGCFSCQSVPVCKKVLDGVGGPVSPFGYGVINFSANYDTLNNSYHNYFSLLSGVNSTNAGTVVQKLTTITNNISTVQSTMAQNPVFPPPENENFQDCNAGVNPLDEPWYCVAVGYCFSIPFNATALSGIQSTLSSLSSSLPSASGIASISANSSTAASDYLTSYLAAKNGNAFTAMLDRLLPEYNSITSNSAILLMKYDNSTLNQSLATLEVEFKAIEKSGINQSISVANSTLNSLLKNATESYQSANASYSQAYLTSQQNTAALLADQLSYQQVPSKLASLANNQQTVNLKLMGRLNSSQITATLPEIQSIKVEAALFVAPLTMGYLIKQFDNSFINSLLSGGNSYAPARISSAPIYAMLESLVIGLLVLLVIYLITYFRVIRKGKLKNNKKLQRNWIAAFVVMIIIVLIYAYGTYAYAQNANNNFLPFNYFLNSVKTSPSVYIALNGSVATNQSIAPCVTKIESYLTDAGKSVQIVDLRNYSCVSGNNISTLGLDCYVNVLSSDKPVIFISQSQQNGITYKGLYGTVLYSSGGVTEGSSCTLASLFSNV